MLPLLLVSSFGALLIVFASYTFRLGILTYVFTAGAARFVPSLAPAAEFFHDPLQLGLTAACAVAAVLFLLLPRSRYFGNVAPLLVALVLLPLLSTQVSTRPVLWALPFLLTFAAGVFADSIETRQRRLFLAIMGTAWLAQAVSCVSFLRSS